LGGLLLREGEEREGEEGREGEGRGMRRERKGKGHEPLPQYLEEVYAYGY